MLSQNFNRSTNVAMEHNGLAKKRSHVITLQNMVGTFLAMLFSFCYLPLIKMTMKVKCHKLFETSKGITNATYEIDVKDKNAFIEKLKASYLLLCDTQGVESKIDELAESITFHREHMKGNAIMNSYEFSV
jgi:23S rRNA pseudoU1915 N3-methylase RlmH